jgi:catechol 2,3-dioxygenase-like lactoylglutathione lyase family enzyme
MLDQRLPAGPDRPGLGADPRRGRHAGMDPRVSLITLGVRNMKRARRFYEKGLGWKPSGLSSDCIAFYQLSGGLVLSLYGLEALAGDANQIAAAPGAETFSGVALAHNLPDPGAVDRLLNRAAKHGGTVTRPARETSWGGYAGYFSDPDGHVWEIAWNPHFKLGEDGGLEVPV